MNDFSVHRIIGRGGFGEVYGCRKADTGKMYVGYTYNIIPWLHLVWFDLAHCVLFLLHSLLGCSTAHTFWVCSLNSKSMDCSLIQVSTIIIFAISCFSFTSSSQFSCCLKLGTGKLTGFMCNISRKHSIHRRFGWPTVDQMNRVMNLKYLHIVISGP